MNTNITIDVDHTLMASSGKRFANLLLDWVVVYAFSLLTGVFLGLLSLLGIDGPLIWLSQADGFDNLVVTVLIWTFYYSITESIFSRSIGKFITGTKVVMQDGSKPSAGVIILRSFCRLIPFEAFSFLGSPPRGWHDSLTETYVVDAKKLKEAMELKSAFDEIGKPEML
ncbi:RDD family protein [Flavobacterium sp.]|uniref:RDD family protein n=1 Tax=Flavobacterium sp. TaxID=239 RepID=UPI002624B85B|nr:RDD family protein [Flavobacterium sp.]